MAFSNFFTNFATEELLFKNLFFSQMIIWNVGQGQWITEAHPDHCLHYDLGGETDVSAKVLKLCAQKPNYLFLSHWDWDHISFAAKYAARAQQACLVSLPQGPASPQKMRWISRIPRCRMEIKEVQILFQPSEQKKLRSNDRSQVLESKNFLTLIPGDSTLSQEKFWSSKISSTIQGLILGHHGSRTSTSPLLMAHLPHLKWAVASARRKKYGHPHREVVETLRKAKVPLLKTEDWGHLHFLKNEKENFFAQ